MKSTNNVRADSAPELLSTSETARHAGISESTLKRHRHAGRIKPYIKTSIAVRYRRSEVEALAAPTIPQETPSPTAEAQKAITTAINHLGYAYRVLGKALCDHAQAIGDHDDDLTAAQENLADLIRRFAAIRTDIMANPGGMCDTQDAFKQPLE